MSRQSQLPPRCPFQKIASSHPAHNTISISPTNIQSHLGHHKSSFQSPIPEEDEQSWLDDLLSDPNVNSDGNYLRRSASDSVTLMDSIMDSFAGINPANGEEDLIANETCNGLGSACIYGPHSPRRRSDSTFSGNVIALAFSECGPQNPLQCAEESFCVSGVAHSDSREDACRSLYVPSAEIKTSKRHSGQRSRVRKLQYIAELERTVDVLQALESELLVRVDSLHQQRIALSFENSKLKEKVARLNKEKLIMEGQYRCLKMEAENLKTGLVNSPNSKVRRYSEPSAAAETTRYGFTWQMLDMTRLNLN